MITIRLTRAQAIVGAVAVALVFFKLWLVEVQDMLIIASPMDDMYFVRTANELLRGNWLGKYTQYTHMAGPAYPMWIALCYLLAVPLHTGQLLLYSAACALAMFAIAPLVQRRHWLILGFAYLLFDPLTYDYSSSAGVFRLGIYPALALLVIACAVGAYVRIAQPQGRYWRWVIGLGLAFPAFWYTREEGMWILPALMLTALLTVVHGRSRGRRSWTGIVAVLVVPPLLWVGAFLGLSYANWKHYGLFTDLEIKTPYFKDAYSALISVRSDQRQQYLMLEEPVKKALTEQSPAFAELAPHLGAWYPATNFIWVFRDSVEHAGYYDFAGMSDRENALKTKDFYLRLGREVRQACDEGRLDCDQLLTTFMPAWQDSYTRSLWPMFESIFTDIVMFNNVEPRMFADRISNGSFENIMLFEYITGERPRTTIEGALEKVPSGHSRFEDIKTHRLVRITKDFYQNPAPWPFYLALAGLLIAVVTGALRRSLSAASSVALVVLCAMMSHISVITLVGIMSSTAQRYLHASYPILLLFTVCGFVLLIQTVAALRRRSAQQTAQ